MEKKLSLSQQIAEIGAGLKFEDLPERVVNNSKMFIMDLLGNIIASRHVDSSLTCLNAVRELGDGDPVSTAIGCNYKTTPQMAALINGTFGHAFDMDDDHRYGTQHSSVVVFPAILALAEKYGCSGKDVLTAFAYGSEITIRLGEAFEGQTYYQGFHPTGTCGVFGATGGAAKLLGLDAEKITYALGLAGSQAAGLLEWKAQGTWSKRYQAGHPAMCGVISAIMAKNGYTAPTTVWDGQDGFLRAYSYKDIWNEAKVYEEFGKRWEMADTSIKVHACCRFSAPLADAGVDLFNRGVDYKQVDSILARVKQAYIPDVYGKEKRKRAPGKEGKLGVEGMRPEVILETLRRAGATFLDEAAAPAPAWTPITKADLMEWGLAGGADSARRRQALLRRLDLPEHLTANGMLEALNLLVSREELEKLLETE